MARIEGDTPQRKQCKANFSDAEVMIMIEDIGCERVTTMSRFQTSMLNSVRSQMKTWRGLPVKPPPFAELVLNIIGEQRDAADRIEGINYSIYSFLVYFTELGMLIIKMNNLLPV